MFDSGFSHILDSTTVVVVGNGHVSERDRNVIDELFTNNKSEVIRFSDMNSWVAGDPITIHVSRVSGSFPPFASYTARHELYVTYTLSEIPQNTTSILVYEASRGTANDLQSYSHRLFPECTSCACAHNRTAFGPSTGGVVLSELESYDNVRDVHVFGMNWMGTPDHVDFADPTIVSRCCNKCTFHPTPDLL